MESNQGEYCGFNLRGAERRIKTEKDNVDGGTGTMTDDDHFFVKAVRQRFQKKWNGSEGDVERELKLGEVDVGAERRTHVY